MATRKQPVPWFSLKYFLICDEARQEIGGKLMLLGVYGDTIIIRSDFNVMPGLAFVFAFKSRGKSPKTATFRLEGPRGLVMPEITMPFAPEMEREADISRTAIIQTNGTRIEIGKYRASLTIDGEEFSGSFDVRRDANSTESRTAVAKRG